MGSPRLSSFALRKDLKRVRIDRMASVKRRGLDEAGSPLGASLAANACLL